MKAPPPDLDTSLLQRALDQQWGIRAAELPYLAVGFGDHHWQAQADGHRFFVTVRDLRLDGRARDRRQAVSMLERTFRAVRRLHDRGGLPFIIPALPSSSGALVIPVGDRFALSVYEWLDVQPVQDTEGIVAAGLVARLHRAWREHPVPAVREDFHIPHRSVLEDALGELDRPWHAGPYGEPARAELAAHQLDVRAAIERYDGLLARAAGSDIGWCLTHGEPSGGNLVQDQQGTCYLVDWESARIAPPERDLVDLGSSDEAVIRYQHIAAGPPVRRALLRLYRLWYALAETSVYLLQFRAPHTADDNTAEAWQNYRTFLPGRQGSRT